MDDPRPRKRSRTGPGKGPGSGSGRQSGGGSGRARPGRKGRDGVGGYGSPRGAGRFEPTRSPRRAPHALDHARHAVCSALAEQAARYPDLDLQGVDTRGLEPRDAAFAEAIYDAAVRRWLTIRHLVSRASRTEWSKLHPGVRGVLLAGAAQLLFLDRVPARAAIFESVAWAKRRVSERSGGLVNAVLRRINELIERDDEDHPVRRENATDRADELPMPDGTALALTAPALPEDPMQRLAVATSHPVELIQHWVKTRGLREVRELAMHALAKPPIILNVAHASDPLPPEAGEHDVPGHAVWEGRHDQLAELLRERRDLWVQDPGSSLAVTSVSDLTPAVIVDACAGLGTKTRQLAATFTQAQIIATDIDQPRFATLERTFADHDRVRTVRHDALIEHAGQADLVLLDVPCSNTGVLARRVEARYRWSARRSESLTTMQRQLVADAIPLLRSAGDGRGAILYSTCSLSIAENEEVMRWASRWHSFAIERERSRPPGGGPGQPPHRYSDGAFAALLR